MVWPTGKELCGHGETIAVGEAIEREVRPERGVRRRLLIVEVEAPNMFKLDPRREDELRGVGQAPPRPETKDVGHAATNSVGVN